MANFNKYLFLEGLTNQLKSEIKEFNVEDTQKLYELIDELINYETTYYGDCFDICSELNAYDFRAYKKECTNIVQLAYACLDEFVREELNFNELDQLITRANNA